MQRILRFVSSTFAALTIAVSIVVTFTVVRHIDGDVEAAPIVRGEQRADGGE